jgi:hypothetical protein
MPAGMNHAQTLIGVKIVYNYLFLDFNKDTDNWESKLLILVYSIGSGTVVPRCCLAPAQINKIIILIMKIKLFLKNRTFNPFLPTSSTMTDFCHCAI